MATAPKTAAQKAAEKAQDDAEKLVPGDPAEKGTDGSTPSMNLPAAGDLSGPDGVDTARRRGGKVLNSNVHLRHPGDGEVYFFEAGDEVPDWASTDGDDPMVGAHLLSPEGTDPRDPAVHLPVNGQEPPSMEASRARWAAYASAHGVVVAGGAGREEIVDALERAGVPTS